jgi:serine/threonine protein phosphatase PrpC
MTRTDLHGIRLEVAGFSEQGPRPENQDAYTLEGFPGAGVVAVADGMGGEKSGRVAADAALQTVLAASPFRSIEDARRAIREADRSIAALSDADPAAHGGMGCALGVLGLTNGGDGPGWIAAHVGDVRILSRSPDGVLRLETRDHTPAFARWEAGEISLDEIPDSAGANRLQRAVGRGGEADVNWLPARPGWSWLIISDGIYKAMRLDELSSAMALPTTGETCEAIRLKVLERGADDNFTAVHVRALGGPVPAIVHPNDTDPMATTQPAAPAPRSMRGGFALALGIAALVLAALALWTAYRAGGEAARQDELETLRTEVDSLRIIVDELRDPFGPAAPIDTPGISTQPPPPGR